MRILREWGRNVSTETCGGKLTVWGDVDEDRDGMYGYVELTELLLKEPRFLELGIRGNGDHKENNDKNSKQKLPMRKSLFAHVPPYIIFNLHDVKNACELPNEIMKHLVWRYNNRTIPRMVRKTVAKSGFSFSKKNASWCGCWSAPMSTVQLKALKLFQKVNHMPGALQLSHKDRLWKNLSKMIERFGKSQFNFTPTTYVFPEDYKRFKKLFSKTGGVWITKPPTGSGGYGIRVVSKWCEIPKRFPLVVQRYITKPSLIEGVKFDMRLYALITSSDPLRIYFYNEGLVRFATSKYLKDVYYLFDRYMHLTNTTLNKTSPMFRPNDSVDKCKGNMWSLNSLWSYLASRRKADVAKIWREIKDVVIKTVISAEGSIVQVCESVLPSKYNAFQLLGFDIMLDENLKPWLLEVNNYPSMDPDTPLCSIVKGQLARDFLNIVGFQIPDCKITENEVEELMRRYKLQLPLCQDHRLYSKSLTSCEMEKQQKFADVVIRGDYLSSILETLTPDDVRQLIRYEDEITQIGNFEKIFPTKNTHVYLKFFEKSRYYNKLFDAWENMYGTDKSQGIKRLRKLCDKKYHLLPEV